MRVLIDKMRHVICEPYSIENLHAMADELGIKRCWFHHDHYDAPKKMHAQLLAQFGEVSPKKICEIVRGSKATR